MKYTSQEIMMAHRNMCRKRGYTVKIVGDYAYRKQRYYKGKLHYCCLIGSENNGNIMVIYDSKIGHREKLPVGKYL